MSSYIDAMSNRNAPILSPLDLMAPPSSPVQKRSSNDTLPTARTSASSVDTLTSRSSDDDSDSDDWNLDLEDLLGPPELVASRSLPSLPQRCTSSSRSSCMSHSSNSHNTRRKQSKLPVRRTVSFDKVRVREFQQILGDHPGDDHGPSLSLGWDYREKKDTKVDKFESKRTTPGLFTNTNLRRSGDAKELKIPADRREKLARKWGYSQDQIQRNASENRKIQQQRRKTVEDWKMSDEDWEDYDPVAIFERAREAHSKGAARSA